MIATIIISAVLIFIVALIIYNMYSRRKKGKGGCGCGCSGCSGSCKHFDE